MALINPAVNKLPPVTLAVALINPAVNKLPPVMLAVALINPAVLKLPPCILPVTPSIPVGMLTLPVPLTFKLMLPLDKVLIHSSPRSTMLPVRLKLPAVVIVPVADIVPVVNKLPPLMLPDVDKLVNVPTLVILGCALATTVLAVLTLLLT